MNVKEHGDDLLLDKIKSLQKHIADLESEKTKEKEESENYQRILNSVINTIPDIVYRLDPEGKITFINDMVKKYNYQPEELIGKSIFDVVHPEDVDKAKWHVNERRTGERRTSSFEVRLLTSEKKAIPFELRPEELHKEPVFLLEAEGLYESNKPNGSTFLGTQAIARDISEKKSMVAQIRQSKKMEAIGLLAGGIAHDFNNLLTIILGYTELLLMKFDKDNPSYHQLKHIMNAGESATALTGQLLAYSRRQILKSNVVDLNSIVLKMKHMLKRIIKENIELVIDLDEKLDLIKTDPNQMQQIMLNLVSNANDAMPDGGKLIIKTKNVYLDEEFTKKNLGSKQGHFVCLSVSDTGIGLDEESQENIFDPFYTTKELGRGTGLGLATVYGIIKQSNGNIWVDSSPGEGTVFDIFLPRTDEQVSANQKPQFTYKNRKGSETILVVEDQFNIRELISKSLQERGYQVIKAINGEDALDKFNKYKKHVHLLLTDVIMPQISGPDLAKQLLIKNPELKVIFMSGYADTAIAQMGVLDIDKVFIKKPFSPIELLHNISELLDK